MKYLNMSQLQEKLGNRSRSSLYRDIEIGRLPKATKIGSRNYWIESEIDEFIKPVSQNEAA